MDDLKLMRAHSPSSVQVKAAGGIRTLDALLEARAIGVTRVGATRTSEMLEECRRRLGMQPLTQSGPAAIPAGY
jgi:deoxyribose-phosphate aldolase